MPPKILTFPAGPQTSPAQATQLWGAEQDSERAGLIRSLSGRDGRLIAILSEPAHNSVCVCVCVRGCARLRVPVLREVRPRVGGRPRGQGVGCTSSLFEFRALSCLVCSKEKYLRSIKDTDNAPFLLSAYSSLSLFL